MRIIGNFRKSRERARLIKSIEHNDSKSILKNIGKFKSLDENEIAQSLISNGQARHVVHKIDCFSSLNKTTLDLLAEAGFSATQIAQARNNPITDIEIILEDEPKSKTNKVKKNKSLKV